MANYLISSVRFTQNAGHNYVSHVLLHVHKDDTAEKGIVKTKDAILRLLDDGHNVKTMRWNYSETSWSIGALVQPYTRDGIRYLRSHKDASTADNLDNMLPMDSIRE